MPVARSVGACPRKNYAHKGLHYRNTTMNPKIPKKIRLDSSLYCDQNRIYSITIITNFKRKYFLNHALAMKIIECLKFEKRRLGCKVFTYCLMPEHLHFLTAPTNLQKSVIEFVNQFKGKSTSLAWKYGIEGSLWQKRWYDHILRKNEDISRIGEYVLNNPVRRGLVLDWTTYPYCGSLDDF